METLALGIASLTVLIISGCCLYCKKPFWSFIGNIAAMALTCWTGYSWRSMLISSGKDPALLGFQRYPAAFILLAALLLSAFILTIISIIMMARQNKRNI